MEEISEGGYIYLQKKGASSGKSSKDWGIMVTSMPMLVSIEAKDPESNDWKDEDGEDVYNNTNVKLKAFDFTIGLVYVGTVDGFNTNLQSMVTWMTQKRMFIIYSPHTKSGKHDCYMKSIEDVEMESTGETARPYVYTFKLKCRCVNPTSTVHCEVVGTTIVLS